MGVFPTKIEEFDDLFSSTLAFKLPGEYDQTLKNHEVLGPLTKNRITHNMGSEIKFTPTYGGNPNIGYIRSTTQAFKYAGSSVITTARLDPAIIVGWQVISDEEERKNRDDDVRLANLAELKAKQFAQDWKRKLVQAFYGNGVLDGQPALKGLKYWVPTNPGLLTIANLSETQYPWWQSKAKGASGDWATNGWFGGTANFPLAYFVATSDGSEQPDLIISDAGLMQVAVNRAGSFIRYTSDGTFNNIGNTNLTFMGKKWVWDKECDAGTMLMLHSDDFTYVQQDGANSGDGDEGMFEVIPLFRLPEQPLMKVSFAWTRHQLINTRRNRQARLSQWNIPT